MFKLATNSYLYSASDLTLFMRSPFASWMARLALDYPEKVTGIEKDEDAMMGLLAGKGILHEANYLEKIKEEYGTENVIEIAADKNTAAANTLAAMDAGYQVIFQAYLQRENFAGYADFLVRREGKSALGDYYYEVWDTKLSKSTKPYFIMQLCCYSWMLQAVQEKLPEEVVVVLGNQIKDNIRIAAYYSYFLNLKQQFLLTQVNFSAEPDAMPDPALCSDYGVWASYAKQLLDKSDSLALVANIRKTQISKLRVAGINTLTELARTKLTSVKGIATETLAKLRAQAELQRQSRNQEKPQYQVLTEDGSKGLSALPPSSKLDVFFDIEGHPLEDGGLEYLWGVSYQNNQAQQGKRYAFKDWWAHTQEQEKLAFEGFIDWVYQRWEQDPTMHVYHYASYEITAISKLSSREQTRQNKTAELLKAGVFVDLYKIVKNGLLIGEPKYSIKNVEHLYRGKRTTDVANGGESVVFYERWREQGGVDSWATQNNGYQNWLSNPDKFNWAAWPELNDIRDYNIDDCESTLELFAWLSKLQQTTNITYTPTSNEVLDKIDKTEQQLKNEQKRQALIKRQDELIHRYETDATLQQDPQAKLLVSLLHFYDRERKPQIWSYFERLGKNDEELFDDHTVVQDISLTSTDLKEGKYQCTAVYNLDQPIRIDKISAATIQGSTVKVSKIRFSEHDQHLGEISFVINADNLKALDQIPLTLLGDESRINTETLENRLCEITEHYFDARVLTGAVKTILNQAQPHFKEPEQPLPVTRAQYPDNDVYLNAVSKAVQAMHDTCLCIQGPPGSGKTYTAKHVISELIKQDKRIGIMSNSHAAIMNLLKPLAEALPAIAMAKVGGFDSQKTFSELNPPEKHPALCYRTSMGFTKPKPYEHFKVVGGTAYAFANDIAYEAPLDYLFVDEASQVALANLIAVSGAAKNIILMGDQMQLEQPIQGSHPGDSGSSALEFMLKGHAVIPEEKGIFLERTYRMHPDVCKPLSEIVYEGKLQADADNVNQTITIKLPKLITRKNGILSITVKHEDNTQSSAEEAVKLQELIDELKTGFFTDKTGQTRAITDKDVLVIAPYNMQVNLLKDKLNGNIKIGTIDKFQGQEAPVVIISMAVSDVAESPRGLDFVFDINRLNVAISRAQALAIVVSNQGLEQCSVNGLQQMAKVGLFCRLVE
jgi:uncharacterized protein